MSDLKRLLAGADVFSWQSDGLTIANHYERQGIKLRVASMDRLNGRVEVMRGLGDPENGIRSNLFLHRRWKRLI